MFVQIIKYYAQPIRLNYLEIWNIANSQDFLYDLTPNISLEENQYFQTKNDQTLQE